MEHTLMTPTRARPANQLREFSVHDDASELYPDDPAYRAVTDFRRDRPISVPADCLLEAALADMSRLGVHALLVTRAGPDDGDTRFIGLVTRHDLQHRRAQPTQPGGAPGDPQALRVADVMTLVEELSVTRYASLRDLTVSDIYGMFQGTGLTHLLIVDDDGNGNHIGMARGLMSRARIAQRLRGSSPLR